MSEERSDDLYGAIGVRDVDLVKRKLEQAGKETEILQAELDKVDVNVSEVEFVDFTPVTAGLKEGVPEPIELIPEITVKWKGETATGHNIEDAFKNLQTKRDKKIEINVQSPKLLLAHRPRTLRRSDVKAGFDPTRPEEGELVRLTPETRDRIYNYFTDRGDTDYDMVFWLKPEEFINLAHPLVVNQTKIHYFEQLREKIFGDKERKGQFHDPSMFLYYNVSEKLITGHEGRHRSFATLMENLETGREFKLPVRIVFKTGDPINYGTEFTERPDPIPLVPLLIDEITQERHSEVAEEIFIDLAEDIPDVPILDPSKFDPSKQTTKEFLMDYGNQMFDYMKILHKVQSKWDQKMSILMSDKLVAEVELGTELESMFEKISDAITEDLYDEEYEKVSSVLFELLYIPDEAIELRYEGALQLEEALKRGVFEIGDKMIVDTEDMHIEFLEGIDIETGVPIKELRKLLGDRAESDYTFIFPQKDLLTKHIETKRKQAEKQVKSDEKFERMKNILGLRREGETPDLTSEEIVEYNEWLENQNKLREGFGQTDVLDEPIETSDEYKGKIEAEGEHIDIDDLLNKEL